MFRLTARTTTLSGAGMLVKPEGRRGFAVSLEVLKSRVSSVETLLNVSATGVATPNFDARE